jgi:hypothetical protein
VAGRLEAVSGQLFFARPSQPVPLDPSKRGLEVASRMALCACGPAAASQGDIVCLLSAPSAGNEGDPRLARRAQVRLLPGKSALARAQASIEAAASRTRTPEEMNEDAYMTTESAVVTASAASSKGHFRSSRRLDPLMRLLTVKLRGRAQA